MQVATLTSGASGLDPALAESLRNAWGGGDVVWLSPDRAAEFTLAVPPGDLAAIRRDIAGFGVDVNVQRREGRRKTVLLADMDSTMIGQECIDELADIAGVGAEVSAITARAMNGELDFEDALRARVALLEGLEESVIDRVWTERITMTPGGAALVATMRGNGAYCALVSGGFTAFTSRVAARLGFDEHRANALPAAAGRLTGEVAEPILGRDAKVAALREICARRGVELADAMAVGDGANDLGMLEVAGSGVALHAKPAVAERARLRIDHGDLTALLYLQGYSDDEFTLP
ncbi:phosphoserine phosphatase [Palleronia aestuarii]|uniref:Phosphoserine phosphatase n=1 Tax=Palleronia aestuarii TaxID=568105 RepID=A0A2W7NUY4_9RHOB|nr:phosphoserine phosphatase SerB [Palleronia aestuarii]PZX15042.1 phosphoserine phosphatase [Palleronia aestuarii]